VARGISKALLEVKRIEDFMGIKVGNSLFLTQLLFLDDMILFSYGSFMDTLKLREILEVYCMAIGMQINVEKY
jgi:hypothetical protein